MSSDVTEAGSQSSNREQMQFDYAWKWFSYHADQRIKMFNYMLVAMGVLTTATVSAYNQNLPWLAAALCSLSALFAVSFSRLDLRNEELVRLAEEVLTHLERTAIFGEDCKIVPRDESKGEIVLGLLWRQVQVDKGLEKPYAPGRFSLADACRGKHRIWLRGLAYAIALMFAVAALLIVCQRITDP